MTLELISRRKLISGGAALAAYGSLPRYADAGWRGANALYVCRKLGITSNLQICLDAGDAASAPASPTKWLDLSGNGYDFFLGTASGADADDPTFVGTPGRLSSGEYFTFNDSFFRYDTTNETWMQNLHKDNAAYTVALWIYPLGGSSVKGIFGTNGGSPTVGTGAGFYKSTSQVLVAYAADAAATAFSATSTISWTDSRWTFMGVSLSEAGGASGSFFLIDGAQETFNAAYTSPATGNASVTMEIGSRGNANQDETDLVRYAMFVMWNRALRYGELQAFRNATRGRFGV